jgi:hypothetical protein
MEMYPSAVHLSTFVQIILLLVLEATQQCLEDLCLLCTLRSTPVSYIIGRIAYNEGTIPDLLVGFRLQVTIWDPLDENWCRTANSFLCASIHLQVAHGEMTWIYPDMQHHCELRTRVQNVVLQSLADTRRDSPEGCLQHCPPILVQTDRKRDWWHRRLQFVPELSAEPVGGCVVLYYRTMAALIYQSAIRDLHRALLIYIGTSQYDLISETKATIACRMPSPAMTHPNPSRLIFCRLVHMMCIRLQGALPSGAT